MVPWRASDDGFVTDDVVRWYERFAEGRPGAIVVEATGVRDVPSGPLLRIGDDRFVPGLTRLADAVRRASAGETRLFIQLIDFLAIKRRPPADKFFSRFLVVTDAHREALSLPGAGDDEVRARLAELPRDQLERVLAARELEAFDRGYRERIGDLHLPHVRDLPFSLPGLFAAATARAASAGFDGVELHAAHAYTLASFLSRTNRRSDGYGGSLAERQRVPLAVYAAARAAAPPRCAVGIRFLADECITGGSDVSDAASHALAFAAAGLDFLSVSRGGKFDDAKQPNVGDAAYPYTGRSGWECMPTVNADERGPFARNAEAARAIKAALVSAGHATPLVVAGGIGNFEQAEALIAEGSADIVGAARQALADPDWLEKVRLGRGDEVRRCELTNYCEGLDQKHKQVTCKLWDRKELDAPDVKLSRDGRRRLTAPPWTR